MDASRIQAEATRLLPLAQRVLKRYPFLTAEVHHLATHSNVMYRIVTEGSQQMVLRIGTPHANSRSNIEVEVAWLDALNSQTELDVVKPIPTAGGALIVDEFDETIGKERACVVFSWVPGQPMAEGSGPFAYRLLGEMSASLQRHGRIWRLSEQASLRIWDRVFYYDRGFDPIIINEPAYSHVFDPPALRVINRAGELAEQVITDSYADTDPQIVHGDLHEWNVHMVRSRLHAFDFEDVMLALPAQDVAISLYSSRAGDGRMAIREAFRKGYESIAPWPVVDESQLDGFHAARQIMLMNYAARTLPMGEAIEYVDSVMPWLARYADRYG